MGKIKIIFNGVTRTISISDKFATELRVWEEFAEMALESMSSKIPYEYKSVPITELPKEVAENYFKITELERQYDAYEVKMVDKLIKKIEKEFKTKVWKNSFHWVKFDSTIQDNEENINGCFDCFDY